jgi:C4-dicarboxylate transporter DctQ subunit
MSKWLSMLENSLLILSSSIMCIIAFANVVSRYLLGNSFAFTEEITINLFVLLTFVGASVGVKNHAHLGFTLLFDKANLSVKKILCLFTGLVVIVVFVLMAYYGVKMVQFQMLTKTITPSLGWQQWIFTLGFPLGCAMCVIRAMEVTFKELKNLRLESE